MRLFVGKHGFIGTGRPVQLGPRRSGKGLSDIQEYGTAKQVTIVVGQNKGLLPKNQGGRCALKPKRFDAGKIDDAFVRMRSSQVGRDLVLGTRTAGRGWYEGKPESSLAFQVAFIPTTEEPTFATFQKNMNRIAETLAEEFCQDSVLILRDDGAKRSAAGASYEPKRTKKK